MNREALIPEVRAWQEQGKRVGFTSGVFDLLHVGHLDYLAKAKAHCDILIVAVNSDESVRANKGPSRPIVTANERAALIAGLDPVDAAYVFEERNNNTNITTLKPDVYIKAGDYKPEQLSSAPLIKSYGGEVVIIPLEHDASSTGLIERVIAREHCRYSEIDPPAPRPAIFLDRDGVICKHVDYLHEAEKFELTPNCVEGLKLLCDAGYALVVITNQGGIGLGYFSHEDFYAVNRAMFRSFVGTGVKFERIFYCPHVVGDHCACRKPEPGMIKRALKELPLLSENSWMVGDAETDIEAGQRLGLDTVRITPKKLDDCKSTHQAVDLLEAAKKILGK